jgi:hypothetical protein
LLVWADPLGGGGALCARAVAWIRRKGNGRGGGGGVQVSWIYFGGRDDARFAQWGPVESGSRWQCVFAWRKSRAVCVAVGLTPLLACVLYVTFI